MEMKLSPQNLGAMISAHDKRIEELEKIKIEFDELKEVIEEMLIKRNSQYRKKHALDSVDDFLKNRGSSSRT